MLFFSYKKWVLWTVILLQTALFFLLPYRIPSVETSLATEKRTISIFTVWVERARSVYLMGYQRMRMEATLQGELLALSASNENVLMGPTVHIPPRLLQARAPQITFWRMSSRVPGDYLWYKGLETGLKSESSLEDLSFDVVLCRKEFLPYLDSSMYEVIEHKKFFSSISITKDAMSSVDSLYREKFIRK